MSELVRGSSVPLFDRLAGDGDGRGGAGSYLLLPEQLEASIARELSRLFNTRCRLPPSAVADSTGTTIDYGIPDFSAMSPQHDHDVALMQKSLAQAIGFFEPRMQRIAVKVAAVPGRRDAATATVSGDVVIGLKPQRVSFALTLNSSQTDATQG